jgi:hypothetical protein
MANYTIAEMERLAAELYNARNSNSDEYKMPLDEILFFRAKKLNAEFVWTDEAKARFIEVSDELTAAFRAAYEEAMREAKNLEARIASGDSFVTDYEIEVSIAPYITAPYDDEGEFAYALCEPYSYRPIEYNFGHSSFHRAVCITPPYANTEINWNKEYFGEVFLNDYIGYCVHALLDSHYWSFSDILNIESVWADVEIKRQNDKTLAFKRACGV